MTDRFVNMKPDDPRPARAGWAPGGYWGKCRDCGENFSGAKRCTQCADCAYATPWAIGIRSDIVNAESVASDLRDIPPGEDTIVLNVNSNGGVIVGALEIHQMIVDYPAKVHVKIGAMASGAAALVAMAGDVIEMHPTSLMHITMPMSAMSGTAEDFRREADLLDCFTEEVARIYAARTGKSRDEILDYMRREVWMTAEAALAEGFCTMITEIKP